MSLLLQFSPRTFRTQFVLVLKRPRLPNCYIRIIWFSIGILAVEYNFINLSLFPISTWGKKILVCKKRDFKEVSGQFSSRRNLDSSPFPSFSDNIYGACLFKGQVNTSTCLIRTHFIQRTSPPPHFIRWARFTNYHRGHGQNMRKDLLICWWFHTVPGGRRRKRLLCISPSFFKGAPPPSSLFSQRTDKKPWLLLTAPGFSATRKGRGREQREGKRRKKTFSSTRGLK